MNVCQIKEKNERKENGKIEIYFFLRRKFHQIVSDATYEKSRAYERRGKKQIYIYISNLHIEIVYKLYSLALFRKQQIVVGNSSTSSASNTKPIFVYSIKF